MDIAKHEYIISTCTKFGAVDSWECFVGFASEASQVANFRFSFEEFLFRSYAVIR
jgi:hypothetical protein